MQKKYTKWKSEQSFCFEMKNNLILNKIFLKKQDTNPGMNEHNYDVDLNIPTRT